MSALRKGMEYGESNRELEDNVKIQAMWKLYEKRLHRRDAGVQKTAEPVERKSQLRAAARGAFITRVQLVPAKAKRVAHECPDRPLLGLVGH